MSNIALINFHKASSAAVKSEGLKHSVNISDGKEVIGHFVEEVYRAGRYDAGRIGYEMIRLADDRINRRKKKLLKRKK